MQYERRQFLGILEYISKSIYKCNHTLYLQDIKINLTFFFGPYDIIVWYSKASVSFGLSLIKVPSFVSK